MSASTPGEDEEVPARKEQDKKKRNFSLLGLQMAHSYTIISVIEIFGNSLLNLRNVWGPISWQGDWSDESELWTEEIKQIIKPKLGLENDGSFWMSFEDFV